jgi:hypothetical protein
MAPMIVTGSGKRTASIIRDVNALGTSFRSRVCSGLVVCSIECWLTVSAGRRRK